MRFRLASIAAAGFLGKDRLVPSRYCFMSSQTTGDFTTDEKDQSEVAKLKQRLEDHNQIASSRNDGSTTARVSSVQIAEGTHKYVLIRATVPGSKTEEQFFVTSKNRAAYHRDAAEPMIDQLQAYGYSSIEVTGGGRIRLDTSAKQMAIYGFSYGFGLADHSMSREVVLEDPRYKDFDVTISDEGY